MCRKLKTHCKLGHEFTPENTLSSGGRRWCRTCQKMHKTSDKRRAWKRKWHREHPESVRNTCLKKTFGITLDDYNKLLASQDGKCAACGETDPKKASKRTKVFPVDHDHKTNKIRGILCMNCNRCLGLMKDSISALENLTAYLRKHQ